MKEQEIKLIAGNDDFRDLNLATSSSPANPQEY
jgi:hypothetical protein